MVAVTAMHLRLTAPRSEPLLLRSADDIDAEFFRIIDREGLRVTEPGVDGCDARSVGDDPG